MTTERDTRTRIVLSWLREDAHENAERVLLRALDEVDATQQRRSWWPARRSTVMNTYAKLLAAAAALLVVAVAGWRLLPGPGGGGNATSQPTPTLALTASPAPTAQPWPRSDVNELAPGSYVTGDPFLVRLTATVPTGWHGWVAGPYYADLWRPGLAGGLYFVLPAKMAVDPCDFTKGFTDVIGPTVADLTEALHNQPGIEVTNEASATIDGYSGTQLVVTAPASADGCTPGSAGFVIWQNVLGGQSPELQAGEAIRIWIVDVAGTRLVVVIQDSAYTLSQRAEVQAIFDSIQLAPGT